MSGIFRTIFGGPSKSKEQSTQQSTSSSQSDSEQGNLAFPLLTQSLAPATNYVTAGGSALGALLGIPGYANAPVAPVSTTMSPTNTFSDTSKLSGSAGPMAPFAGGYENDNAGYRDYTGMGTGVNDIYDPNISRNQIADEGGSIGRGDSILSRLIGGGSSQPQTGPNWNAYLQANPDVAAEAQRVTADHEFASPAAYAQWHYQHYGQNEGRALPTYQPATPVAPATPTNTSSPALVMSPSTVANPTAGQAQGGALNDFANSAGMQFIQDQQRKMIEGSQAGKGLLQSGATAQALQDRGNSLASTYLNQYIQNLLGFSNLGNDASKNLAIAGDFGTSTSSSTGQSTGQSTGNSEGAKKGILPTIVKAISAIK